MSREATIPIGMALCGFFTSSPKGGKYNQMWGGKNDTQQILGILSNLWWQCSQTPQRRKSKSQHPKGLRSSRRAWTRPHRWLPHPLQKQKRWKERDQNVNETFKPPKHEQSFTHFTVEFLVEFRMSSGFKLQFFLSPLTNPEMMTNSSTSTLMQVKTLLTRADSLTPNTSRPAKKLNDKAQLEPPLPDYHIVFYMNCKRGHKRWKKLT